MKLLKILFIFKIDIFSLFYSLKFPLFSLNFYLFYCFILTIKFSLFLSILASISLSFKGPLIFPKRSKISPT
jgi:hypothetical protein